MEAKSGGEEVFKQAAIDAARKSEWFPAISKDMPVSVWVTYPIRFTLKGYGWLGIQMQPVTDEIASRQGLKSTDGVAVGIIMDGSPAQKAGVKQGDVILEVDGKQTEDVDTARNIISAIQPGRTVTLKVVRDKQEMTLRVTLGERPSEGGSPPPGARMLEEKGQPPSKR